MNLRDQLKEILPDILPRNPKQSIKGTELIESVKYRLKQEYSDATLRYHFSIMSCDPSSPIAKVAQGQGYYLRTETIHSMNSAMNMISAPSSGNVDIEFSNEDSDLAITRANKFRSLVQKYFEAKGRTPFSFEESFSSNALVNRWQVPDLAIVDWMASEQSESDGIVLDRHKLDIFRKLSKSPVQITGAKLRLEINPLNVNEDLYQCLATSEWSSGGQLIIAAPIDDPLTLERILEFAARYGIGVLSFGLDADIIDDLPEPAAIDSLRPDEYDSISSLFEVRCHASASCRSDFDWQHVSESSDQIEDFRRFGDWISNCLVEERVITPRDFLHQERATGNVAVVA